MMSFRQSVSLTFFLLCSITFAACSTSVKKSKDDASIKTAPPSGETASVVEKPAVAEKPVETKPARPATPPVSPEKSVSEAARAADRIEPPKSTDVKPAEKPPVVVAPPAAVVEKAAPPAPVEAPKVAAPITKKGPNHFVITIAEKTAEHPLFGKGHKLGLALDAVPGKSVVLKRGETYEFDVQTDPLHDVYFSTSPMGWGGGTVTEGIKGQFTYRGTIVVTPTEATPEVLYYQCRNHSSMGGKVVVVNKGTAQADIDRLLASGEAAPGTEGSRVEQKDVPVDAAKQKIMLADMMLQSGASKTTATSGSESSKTALVTANEKLAAARQELSRGNNGQALALADAALKLVTGATRNSTSDENLKQQRSRYNESLETLKNFRDSHKQNFDRTVKKRGAAAAVDYDHAKVDQLVSQASGLADKNQFDQATQSVVAAERLVTQAIHGMLNAQTIVYDLSFESPAEEYDYELKRYVSYEELIPIAIEEKKPAEAVVKLMGTYVDKGRAQKADAEQKAKSGNYPEGISLLLAATEELRRALRLAGVSQ